MICSRRLGGTPQLFDPLSGEVVREPRGTGSGWWAGAPGAFHDAASGRFWLTYRLREPRPVRGGITRLAVSDDGVHFTDVLECRKEALGSQSIERCAILRTPDGRWHWYLSYVDPQTSQWRIDHVSANQPEQLDPAQREPLFTTAGQPELEGAKDPYLFCLGRLWYLVASVALSLEAHAERHGEKHGTGDIFNTGLTISASALAVSHDAVHFGPLHLIDTPRGAWDAYCLRINSLLWTPPVFTAFYDGSASVEENYEERCGLAQSLDLRQWDRISVDGPALTVPHGSGSVRYVDCLSANGRTYYYYEMVRADGSHELRVSVV